MPDNILPFRVLSLDGGGMRGTYTATYLDRVATGFQKRRGVGTLDIGKIFNLIVGTSTGGIIACALAAGVPMAKILDLYITNGAAIFPRQLPSGIGGAISDFLKRPASLLAGEQALRQVLQQTLGNITVGQLYSDRGIALAIPSIEMSQHRPWVFKTPHLAKSTNHRDDDYSLVDVCMATTAAPLYRSMAAIDHPGNESTGFNVFVDGGLWANNPVLIALIDALEMTVSGQEIQIYCLGTCPSQSGEQISKREVHRGLSEWKFGGEVASLSVDAQQMAYDYMAQKIAKHLDRRCTVVRFPSMKVPFSIAPLLGLDQTSNEAISALINQARVDSDMLNSEFYRDPEMLEARLIREIFEAAPTFG
jgi:predicted acylesterase/phospholipase RssA